MPLMNHRHASVGIAGVESWPQRAVPHPLPPQRHPRRQLAIPIPIAPQPLRIAPVTRH